MKPLECPSCYSRVILSDEGRCPACSRLPTDPSADPSRTKVTLWEGIELPRVCLGCGMTTDMLMTIRRTNCSEAARYARIILGLLIAPFLFAIAIVIWPLFRLLSLVVDPLLRQGVFSVVKIRIPCCRACQERKLPRCDWIDYEEGKMAFIVPKDVAKDVPKN